MSVWHKLTLFTGYIIVRKKTNLGIYSKKIRECVQCLVCVSEGDYSCAAVCKLLKYPYL